MKEIRHIIKAKIKWAKSTNMKEVASNKLYLSLKETYSERRSPYEHFYNKLICE